MHDYNSNWERIKLHDVHIALSTTTIIIILRSHSQCILCWRADDCFPSQFSSLCWKQNERKFQWHISYAICQCFPKLALFRPHILRRWMLSHCWRKKILNSSSNGPILFCWYSWRSVHLHLKFRLTFLSISIFERHEPNNRTQISRIRPFYSTALSSISFIFSIVKFDSRL